MVTATVIPIRSPTVCIFYLWAFWQCPCASAAELHGEFDVRLVVADTQRSWIDAGQGKTLYDNSTAPVRLGQAVLRGETELADSLAALVTVSARDDRDQIVDVQEAWLNWNPVQQSQWRTRLKVGAFLPVSSLEIGYDSPGWTPARTLSSSAINSWIGEELRTKGVEITLLRRGIFTGSRHDYGITLSAFTGNDPAGTLLAWQGWHIGDRVTGLSESLRLSDLPALRVDGDIPLQTRDVHLFREIDHRPGYYVNVQYAYAGKFDMAAMHYDNRGSPAVVDRGQYSWSTRFNHLSLRITPMQDWEVLFQALAGSTNMGPNVAHVKYWAWYVLASHPMGAGKLTVRHDEFATSESDTLPSDPNMERGRAWTLAYNYPVNKWLNVVAELLVVDSNRASRALFGEAAQQREVTLVSAARYRF